MFFYGLVIFLLQLKIFPQADYINQAGYKINGYKYFYTDSGDLDFAVCRTGTGDTVYQGNFSTYTENDAATGLSLSRGEFSDLNDPGSYFIKNSNIISDTFIISADVYEDVLYKSLKGFYFWRCGTALTEQYAGVYDHAVCHTSDGLYHSSSGKTGSRNTTGGWHDAGDYGKYVVNAGISTGTLLMAYELFPAFFSMDNLNIPESGNSIPDILDEVRFELSWLLKMQDDDGGVFHKVTALSFPGFIMPENDKAARYIYQVSSAATADFTALMAKAYRIFKPFDSSFADSCLAAAALGVSFLYSNPDIVPAGGFRNPGDTQSGEYGNGYDKDERLWAYSELYLSTNSEEYLNNYTTLLSQQAPFSSEMSWPNVAQMGNISYLFSEGGDEELKSTLSDALISYSDNLLNNIQNDGFNVSIRPGEYNWGSNAVVLNRAIILILAYELTRNEEYLKGAYYQYNYILGTNAHNMTFITGVGIRSPMHIHHRPSAADNIAAPVPGYIAGGPNEYLQDNVLSSNFTNETPPALCYIDNSGSYASNEVCLNWNAPLVFTAGYFNSINYTAGIKHPEENNIPSQFNLYQNFPNPFNPSTKIKYCIPPGGITYPVQLKIYDILGRIVAVLVNEEQRGGTYEILFNAGNLSSGVYFYRLNSGGFSISRKMAVIK
jgi:endoglucanase